MWELGDGYSFNAFVMLKIRFSNHRLIKISMIHLQIKSKVKIKLYISDDYSYKLRSYWVIIRRFLFGEGDFSWTRNEHFLLPGEISSASTGFSSKVWGKGPESRCMMGRQASRRYKQDESRGNIFGNTEKRQGLIQIDNSTGHCFALRDLICLNK